MSTGTSLRDVARLLINTFGTSCNIYSYSGATKTEDSEGDITVGDWKTATATLGVISDELQSLSLVNVKGVVTDTSATIILRDDVTIAINDKIALNSRNYRVDEVDSSNRVSGTLIVQTVNMTVR